MAFEAYDDVIEHLPYAIEGVYNKSRFHSALGCLGSQQFEDPYVQQIGGSAA